MDTILDIVFKTVSHQDADQRPKVCLTWAQSLDGRLSLTSDTTTLISGNSSMQMTHALRALHQTILVGIGTLLSDNPRLTCRMDPATRDAVHRVTRASETGQRSGYSIRDTCCDPTPVILDSNLRTPSVARCLQATSDTFRPFVFHHSNIGSRIKVDPLPNLVQAIQVPLAKSQRSPKNSLDLGAILLELRQRGIKSVMVEGGASVISSFLDTDLWDIVIVTVSAQLFRTGVTLQIDDTASGPNLTQFRQPKWIQLGNDIIFIGFP